MAFHAGSGPSAMIDMSEGNPIRVSVQQGFDDPSITPDDALATQVSATCCSITKYVRMQVCINKYARMQGLQVYK